MFVLGVCVCVCYFLREIIAFLFIWHVQHFLNDDWIDFWGASTFALVYKGETFLFDMVREKGISFVLSPIRDTFCVIRPV